MTEPNRIAKQTHDHAGRHERLSFRGELADAVTTRAVGLVVAVLLLGLAFIASYVGAFHHPTPHHIPIAVAAPAQVSVKTTGALNALSGHPVSARAVRDELAARQQIRDRVVDAALVVNPSSSTDTVLVATAAGSSVTDAASTVIRSVESAQHRTVTVTDIAPIGSEDYRGLSGFYLVVGWLVAGYLAAAILGVAGSPRPANRHRAVIRLGAMVPYAICSAIGGALIVGPWLGALTGHFWALAGVGVLLVLAAAWMTIALQIAFGVVGIGVTILAFVIIGNPSSGGPYQYALLPAFWRGVGPWLPNGAGTSAIRNIVYFGGHDIRTSLLVLAGYVVAGLVVGVLVAAAVDRRRGAHA